MEMMAVFRRFLSVAMHPKQSRSFMYSDTSERGFEWVSARTGASKSSKAAVLSMLHGEGVRCLMFEVDG